MDIPKKIRTPDLYFAAYLKAIGVPLASTEREGTRCYFVFACEDEDPGQLRTDFFGGQGVCSALELSSAIKNLKSLVHE